MRNPSRLALLLPFLLGAALAQVNPDLYAGLQWRNIGPLRAGRVAAVTGVVGQPGKYYIGLPGGGVWETDDGGVVWYPIFDSVTEVDSVGAIEVAPSNAQILYAGTGDLITGLSLNEGHGMYKSTDAGKTWRSVGLTDTHRIDSILIDPHNPDIVLAATQGDVHFKSADRGVYRSTDGGGSWTKVLYHDDQTGARDMAWAYDKPSVIFATTQRNYNPNPGAATGGGRGGGRGGAPGTDNGTALYKSTDEGVTWTQVGGGGLPSLNGRTSVAVAANTNGQRVYLVGGFGLYRSDDGGANWSKATTDTRIVGSDYICGVYVDTKNPDIVYNMQTSMYRSTDGGHTWISFKGAPGGDDNHVLWIDPTDSGRMLLGSDQGAAVSLDAGKTWSPWYNQATAQVYRISADNSFPYWVYATQQDSGAVGTRSRGDLGEITPFDWYPVPGGEAGYIVPDPLNPNIVFSGGLGSALVKITRPQWGVQDISPGGNGKVYRRFTNPPIVFLPQDPHTMLFGSQYVSVTTDGGDHWRDISPDLSAHNGLPPVPPAYGRNNPALSALTPSPVKLGVIWTGSNNGLIYLTQDSGAHWKEVTPPGLPDSAEVNFVEASHSNPAEAYAEVDNRNVGDYKPHIYRTRDYGATWTETVNGLPTGEPSGSFVRVVREDTQQRGLLFCGTETTVYVSFDDGDHWQSLRQNLPTTSYRDLVIHGNDLIVGTYGRSFWVLDDMSPLREIAAHAAAIAAAPAYLFKPGEAIRVYRDVNGDTPFPPEVPHAENPPPGALLYYYLGAKPVGDIRFEILDASGKLVRTLSSAPQPPFTAPLAVPDYWKQPPQPMPAEVGTNRINWDLLYDSPASNNRNLPMSAIDHDTPATPEGPLALPGVYSVRLIVNGKAYTQSLTVRNDPRHGESAAVMAGLRAQHDLQMRAYDGMRAAAAAEAQVRDLRSTIARLTATTLPASVAGAATAMDTKAGAVAGAAAGGRGGGGRGRGGAGGAPTLSGANAALLAIMDLVGGTNDAAPTAAQTATFRQACGELNTSLATWRSLNAVDLPALNQLLRTDNLAPIAPAAAPPAAVCAPAVATGAAAPKP